MIIKNQGLAAIIVFILIGISIMSGTRQDAGDATNKVHQYQITYGN